MAIVGNLHYGNMGGLKVILGSTDAASTTEDVVTGFNTVLFILVSYSENPGDVQPCYGVDASGTVTFTMTANKQADFMIFGL